MTDIRGGRQITIRSPDHSRSMIDYMSNGTAALLKTSVLPS